MKIRKLNETDYVIYLFNKDIDFNNINEEVKRIIKKIQKLLKLKGFYRTVVVSKSIGLFIKLIKLDDAFYKNTLDLKIEIRDEDIYFKTDDYFKIDNLSKVVYLDGMYYCIIDDSFEEILEKVEFGSFVFGDEINLNRGFVI